MSPDIAFRRRLALAAQIRSELAGLLDTPRERAAWLTLLAEQMRREEGKPREEFPLEPDSPEASFLP